MRNAALGALAGLLLVAGCSGVGESEPDVAILVPTTEADFTDEWHTSDWPVAGSTPEETALPADDEATEATEAQETSNDTNPPPRPEEADSEADPATESPEVLAFDDTGAEFCQAVQQMREVLQWSNATFTELSAGSNQDMVANFQNAVAEAQTRDQELIGAVETASEKTPSLAADFATIRDRQFWVMASFEEIASTANDGFEVNSAGLELFESAAGLEWAGLLENATQNVDAVYRPACGAGFNDPTT